MSDYTRPPITIHYGETAYPLPRVNIPHPCADGHRWAWLRRGGIECARCGVRP